MLMKSHLLIKFFLKLLIIILISFTFVYVFQLITLNAASVNSGSFAVDYTIVMLGWWCNCDENHKQWYKC